MVVDNKPRLYILALTRVHPQMYAWLEEFQSRDLLEKRLKDGLSDGAILIEMCGRRCYKSFVPGLNPNVSKVRENARDYLRNVINQEHGSVFAHATITVAFENVSRVFTHEAVRNAIGNAFSQESMRYVRFDNFTMRVPNMIAPLTENLICLTKKLEKELAKLGKTIDQMPSFAHKKEMTSALRRFMPTVNTGIIITFNWRSLRWFINQRSAPGAEEEMREVAGLLYDLVKTEIPEVFLDATWEWDEISLEGQRKCIRFEHPKI